KTQSADLNPARLRRATVSSGSGSALGPGAIHPATDSLQQFDGPLVINAVFQQRQPDLTKHLVVLGNVFLWRVHPDVFRNSGLSLCNDAVGLINAFNGLVAHQLNGIIPETVTMDNYLEDHIMQRV